MPNVSWRKRVALKFIFVLSLTSAFLTCGEDFRDISTASGRQAILDDANNYLTDGSCEAAISVLSPLYFSQYVNHEVRMTFASAYACRGGLNFAQLAASLNGFTSGDIWALLVSANYSQSSSDGKVAALERAAEIILTTSAFQSSFEASARPKDANVYMIFLQMNIIATTISTDAMGKANSTTGKKTQSIAALGTNADKCRLQIALSVIADSSAFVATGSSLTSLLDSVNTACGGTCPANKDPSVCTAAEQAQGTALIIGIDSQWGT
jgi:hypothetical protein